MREPGPDEMAAIAAAYALVAARHAPTARPAASRWSIAGRLPANDLQSVRFAARSASRWNAAGRLDA
jgi:hypothetical protein